jgi:hypothetical protein
MTRKSFILAVSGAAWSASGVGASEAGGSNFGPIRRLEASARDLNKDNEASIYRLTSEILDFPHPFEIPSAVKIMCHPRLCSAERSYARSQTLGVHENDIVALVADVATTLSAPPFALVSSRQVRVVRMKLVQDNPVFMGRGLTMANPRVGDSICPYMSPLQATHLSLIVADQKLLNEDYQHAPPEWEARYQQQEIRRTQRLRQSSGQGAFMAVGGHNARGAELSARVNERLESMSMYEITALATRCLERLGL